MSGLEFKFDGQQEYQVQAVEAVAGLFEGQARPEVELLFALGTATVAAVPNRLDLTAEALLGNLQRVQAVNGVPFDQELQTIVETVETEAGKKRVSFPNFSVEMETGTGKTYVYLRTALELARRYGLRKYIVVVPSVAIREGVLKTLRQTEGHFRELFGNMPYTFNAYDSGNLTLVREFALAHSAQFLVMTIDSFNKASNVIRQSTDRLQGETPIHLLQAARPILILDEPQNMESEQRIKALAGLDPLLALRYSATHRTPYNVVYRLTPYEAYRQGLVKRIEVAGITQEEDANRVFVELKRIDAKKTSLTARLGVFVLQKTGKVAVKEITVKPGDQLRSKTGLPDYDGFEIDEINAGGGFVRFANNVELRTGESRGVDKAAIFREQIRYTVEEHLRRQHKLRGRGIKVLSLFFIDRVANYVGEDAVIRRLFDAAFAECQGRHPEWADLSAAQVQSGYFAQKRRKDGVDLLDSVGGQTEADRETYDLIMRDKERLLSFDEPVSFIFSHSALREGWDNPNVFQICTLNESGSEVRKRQEIGRGVRLPVDQTGARVQDAQVNVLTVVANQSYERYVQGLQQELDAEFGTDGAPPKPANARARGVARLNKLRQLSPDFQELWARIQARTRYVVSVDTERLLAAVVPEIAKLDIRPPSITVAKGEVVVGAEDKLWARQQTGVREASAVYLSARRPNLVGLMLHLMEHTTPPVRLTRRTIAELFRRLPADQQRAALDNPHEFATEAVRLLKEHLADHLVAGIRYEPLGEWWEMSQFMDEIEGWADKMIASPHGLYDQVVFESETERKFVEGLENRDDVRLYVKLPDWFKVPTPIGEYNPDWAVVMADRDEHGDDGGRPPLYLVRETKSTAERAKLRADERRKIECGEAHFIGALGGNYKVATSAADLP